MEIFTSTETMKVVLVVLIFTSYELRLCVEILYGTIFSEWHLILLFLLHVLITSRLDKMYLNANGRYPLLCGENTGHHMYIGQHLKKILFIALITNW